MHGHIQNHLFSNHRASLSSHSLNEGVELDQSQLTAFNESQEDWPHKQAPFHHKQMSSSISTNQNSGRAIQMPISGPLSNEGREIKMHPHHHVS